jgi:hypothetical protein
VQAIEQFHRWREFLALHRSKGGFQRLAGALDLRQVDRTGGAFQAVRFAEDNFDDFGASCVVRRSFKLGDSGK